MRKINVLSLCDGLSCGRMALERLGFEIGSYYASEIKTLAVNTGKRNFPDNIYIGDVNKVHYENGRLFWEGGEAEVKFDLVCFSSPCQTFSIACITERRIGMDDGMKSGLFLQCKRVLDEVKPEFFLMENVYSMKKADVDAVTEFMGVKPVMYDGADISPAIRKRWYWTNIPQTPLEKKEWNLQEILEDGWTDRGKARCLAVIDSRPNTTPVKMFHRYYSTGFTTLIFQSREHYEACVKEYQRQTGGKRKAVTSDLQGTKCFDGVRYMTRFERALCQGVEKKYIEFLSENDAADLLGDGWQVDVIAHIFEGMRKSLT